MADKKTRIVTKTVEHHTTGEPGQRRVVRTVVTKSSGEDFPSRQDLFSKFEGMNISERSSSSSTYVTKTVQYVTKDGKVTKTMTGKETNQLPSFNQTTKIVPQSQPKMASPIKSSPKKELASPAKESKGDFAEDCLKWHNHYRSKHGVPPLKLSSKLCSYAEEWAKHLAATDTFQHRQNNKYGENIYMEWSSNPNSQISGQKPVDSWYSEISMHQFGREPTSLRSGHFTQVIWKTSKELGVAYSRNRGGKIYVVANYDPAGNMIGQFAQNVPSPVK